MKKVAQAYRHRCRRPRGARSHRGRRDFGFSSNRMNKVYTLQGEKLAIPADYQHPPSSAAIISRLRSTSAWIATDRDHRRQGLHRRSGNGAADCHQPDEREGRCQCELRRRQVGARHPARREAGRQARAVHAIRRVQQPERHGPRQCDRVREGRRVHHKTTCCHLRACCCSPRVLYVTGMLPLLPVEMIDHNRSRPAPVAAAPTAEYGEYLANVGGCKVRCDAGGRPGAWHAAIVSGSAEFDADRNLAAGRKPTS